MRYGEQSWVERELSGVPLPDGRFRANLTAMVSKLASAAGNLSFSAALGERLRKCAWRLFGKGELHLLSAHGEQTRHRCEACEGGVVLIVEDTTDLVYDHKGKMGLGVVGGVGPGLSQGLNVHTALALSDDGQALGIVHQRTWAPSSRLKGQKRYLYPIEQKESLKWIETLWAVDTLLGHRGKTVFIIADREADFFEHYAEPRAAGVELLVRVQQKKRKLLCDAALTPIAELLTRLQPLGEGAVRVWRRKGEKERIARVNYCSVAVTVPPTYLQTASAVPMHLLWIKEKAAAAADDADSSEAIEWVLLTSAPATTLEEVVTLAGYYARRWTVERFHFILKSGLGIEKLQIEQATRLVNAVQLYSLVAWHLLCLYRLAHGPAATHPATDYVDAETVDILEATMRAPLPTVRDFVLAVGRLGGFRPTTKQPLPGEKCLWLGLRQLQAISQGFQAAKEKYGTG